MFSRAMYSQTSSSVQLLIGKARKCSPGRCRVLNSVHNSGRWSFGCHWPKLSRWLKMRSLARAFSSSRRAPPISASKRCSSIASSSVTRLVAVARFERMRQAHAAARDRVFEVADDQALAHLGDALVAKGDDLGEVVAGVDVQQRKGQPAFAMAARVTRA